MNKAEVQESLVTLYLRLNGYFTSGFIVHSPIHGRNRTEVDVLAVRFPFNAEPARGVGSDDELGTSNNSVEFIIGEVKSRGQQLRFNAGLRCSRDAVDSVLQWCGHFSDDERPGLTDSVMKILEPQAAGDRAPSANGPRATRVRAVLFSPERAQRRNNQPWFVPGSTIFAYIWRCLRPPVPRDACATTYDFGAWGRELEPIVEYFKDQNRPIAGGLPELLEHFQVEPD
jgi:hypothetical protein